MITLAKANIFTRVADGRHKLADAWEPKYRRAIKAELDAQVMEVAADLRLGAPVAIMPGVEIEWLQKLIALKKSYLYPMIYETYQLVRDELEGKTYDGGFLGKQVVEIGEDMESFLLRVDLPDIDGWIIETSKHETKTSANENKRHCSGRKHRGRDSTGNRGHDIGARDCQEQSARGFDVKNGYDLGCQ